MESASEEFLSKVTNQRVVDWDDFEEFERKIDDIHSILNAGLKPSNDDSSLVINDRKMISTVNKNERVALTSTMPKEVNVTHINRNKAKSQESLTSLSSPTMTSEAFMRVVEEDANRRHKECQERNDKSNTLMREGNKAFKDGRLEKSLCHYNQAIDIRRDSSVLYTNRALVFLRFGLFSKCVGDCEAALKIKDTLKSRLLKWKALRQMGDLKSSVSWLNETKSCYSSSIHIITDYVTENGESLA